VSQWRVAVDCGMLPRRVNEIVLGKRGITADTALRLGRYFGTGPEIFMNLQTAYDLAVAEDRLGDRLPHEVKVLTRSA
jgi:antitoxin HigA-1